jgi:hypothetical protein
MALGNLVHRVDDEEAAFLDEVSRGQMKMERAMRNMVNAELRQFRALQGTLQDGGFVVLPTGAAVAGGSGPTAATADEGPKLVRPEARAAAKRDVQRDVLKGTIVRKRARASPPPAAPAAAAPVPPAPAAPKPVPPKAATALGLDYGSDEDDDDNNKNNNGDQTAAPPPLMASRPDEPAAPVKGASKRRA